MSRADSRTIAAALRQGTGELAVSAAERFADRAEREGLVDVAYATLDTPIGTAGLAATGRGLVRVVLPNQPLEPVLEDIAVRLSPRVLESPARLDEARRELEEYFEGKRDRFELELDWSLVPPGFYSRVLRETAKLPYGVTATYGELAARAGNPRAFRAAGTALGSNPIPLVVPCHRVLRAGGVIGNYGGGPAMKEFLLRLEGAVGGASRT
jgi:methylated-DNA-[protein]-cysteine S-methyltransferase